MMMITVINIIINFPLERRGIYAQRYYTLPVVSGSFVAKKKTLLLDPLRYTIRRPQRSVTSGNPEYIWEPKEFQHVLSGGVLL